MWQRGRSKAGGVGVSGTRKRGNTHQREERELRCDTFESPRGWLCANVFDRSAVAVPSPKAAPRRSATCLRARDDHEPFRRRHRRASTSTDRRPNRWWIDGKKRARTDRRWWLGFPEDLRRALSRHKERAWSSVRWWSRSTNEVTRPKGEQR